MIRFIAFIILLLFALCPTNTLAQLKWCIENGKCNTLYMGLDNPMSVVVEGQPCKNVFVTSDQADIENQNGDCHFIVHPKSLKEVTIVIWVKKAGSKPKLMGTMSFRCVPIPQPRTAIVRKNAHDNGITELAQNGDSIKATDITDSCLLFGRHRFPDNAHYNKIIISSYTVLHMRGDSVQRIFTYRDQKYFDRLFIAYVNNSVRAGDRLLFANIQGYWFYRTHTYEPLELYIKE